MLSIPKLPYIHNELPPGWFPGADSRVIGSPNAIHPLAYFLCPNGHLSSIGLQVVEIHDGVERSVQHTISPDGTVSPSVICPRYGCGFHDHIRLLDWAPPSAKVPI